MARMIPEGSFNADVVGERRLYRHLQSKLSDDFTILHRLSFIQEEATRIYDHEIDFLLIHRELGLLAIEVKGGIEIDYDPDRKLWSSTDHTGRRHELDKDPFDQARANMYRLVEEIARRRVLGKAVTSRQAFPYAYSYAVAFPDVELGKKQFTPHATRDIIIDFSDLTNLDEKIQVIMRRQASEDTEYMGDPQFNALLHGYLARKFQVSCSVSRRLEDEAASFKRLTGEQCEHLNFLDEHKRVLVKGYAGTGKTQMAMEKARRLAQDGLDVLFLCYNRALARDLDRAHQDPWGNIDIDNYHNYCRRVAEAAGLPFVRLIPQDKDAAGVFWKDEVPAILEDNIAEFPLRYDAVIIDEGQDFQRNWLEGIMGLLRDKEEGHLYIFFDEYQNLFAGELDFPVAGPPLCLYQNCRNTQSICSIVANVGSIDDKYYKAKNNPVGAPVEFYCYRDDNEQIEKIREIIAGLKKKEVFPNKIAILSPRKRENSCLAGVDELAGYIVEDLNPEFPGEGVVFSTVKSFKGLEKDVVIFCDVDKDFLNDKPREAYTAVSRAQHLLFVVHHENWVPPQANDG